MSEFIAGPHSRELWEHVEPIIKDIEALPFIEQLSDGGLDPKVFVHYLLQDEVYLDGYGRAMAQLSSKSSRNDDMQFWAGATSEAVVAENELHEAVFADEVFAPLVKEIQQETAGTRGLRHGERGSDEGRDAEAVIASPTSLGYVSFLMATAALRPYQVGVAGVLPCFWVYAHIGKVLMKKAGSNLEGHPFASWITMYDSPEFDESTRGAVAILEREMEQATPALRAEMKAVFEQASLYELHFWASAHVYEDWTTPMP
ncbi:TenA family protein [Brevibacterium ravenspurgense]|uniref:TenA family protein n=1 Tax=Brevibacterium ravenspurgense TaxID=479117 RepID=UPI0003049255|nr:TenA family protein [Brevibacterium ravenspurgense]